MNNRAIHVRQRYNWDCGLACTEMAMKCVNASNLSAIQVDSSPMVPITHGEPLWTIELYIGMRERGLNAEMSTSVKGVNTEHINLDFYKQAVGTNNDTIARINTKFHDVEKIGWRVSDAVPTDALPAMFAHSDMLCAIVLVNWYILTSRNLLHTEFFGHCILLIGYDISTSRFMYMDPLLGPLTQFVDKTVFDAARVSPGTDMDMIIVHPTRKITTHEG